MSNSFSQSFYVNLKKKRQEKRTIHSNTEQRYKKKSENHKKTKRIRSKYVTNAYQP